MNLALQFARRFRAALCSGLLILLAGGCETTQTGLNSGGMTNATPVLVGQTNADSGSIDSLTPGMRIVVEIKDIPNPPAPSEQVIREDGTITLHLNQTVVAAGKTKGQLSDEIYNLYVPKYYRRMTVNIMTGHRFYFIGGEVKQPSQREYMGRLSVVKAIQAAGDFTEYANKRKVQIQRADGKTETVNVLKAIENPNKYDVPIYPGDRIYVPRSIW